MEEDPLENKGNSSFSEDSGGVSSRSFRAGRGVSLLWEVETAICGPHVSEFPEVAEGLSLTSRRTAVICLKKDVPSRKLRPGVYHFQIPTKWSSFYRDAIMLAPSSFQEAVDLCPAAHLLGDRTHRPVVCIHRAAFGGSFGKIKSPTPEQIEAAAATREGEKEKLTPEGVMGQLEELKKQLGVEISAIRLWGDPQAPIAVVIPGLAPPRLRKMLANRPDIKVISLTLINPFPLDRIMDLIGEAEKVVLMLPRRNPFHKRIFSNLKYYLGERYSREVWTESSGGVATEIVPPLLAEDAAGLETDAEKFRLGISSSGEGAARLLQEFAAECPVCRDGEFDISRVERCDLTVLTSGAVFEDPDCDRGLDLLLVDLSEGKRAETGLKMLSPEGHLVLIGDLNRLEGLAEDMASLRKMRKISHWKIWTGSERMERGALVSVLAGLLFGADAPSGAEQSEGRLQRISGEALEQRIKERRRSLAEMNGSMRFPEEGAGRDDSGQWAGIIREFFLTGSCPEDIYSQVDFSSPALPAVFHRLEKEKVFENGYPLLATRKNGSTVFSPIREILAPQVEESFLSPLIKAFAAALEERARAVCLLDEKLLNKALETFASGPDIDEDTAREVESGVRKACRDLVDSARIFTFSRAVLPVLCHAIASEQRTERRDRFREEVSALCGQLGDLLQAEERRLLALDEEEVAGELGTASGRFLDPAAIAKLHSRHRSSPGFSREKKEELERSHEVLKEYLEATENAPEAYFVFEDYTYEEFPLPGISVQTHENPFLFAAGIFDGLAEGLVEVLKAVQSARKETESDGSSGSDSLTEKLDWTFLEKEELFLIPPVVVLISSESVFERRLSSLGRLISSGRPVSILVTSREFDVTGDEVWPKHSGISPDLWHLVLSFRELFVIQSSLALPMHTVRGMRKWISQPVPSVALIAVPRAGEGGFTEWWRSYAACLGRAVPIFKYDPEAGSSWRDRLDLEGNVLPDETWIRQEFEAKTTSGEVKKMEDTITPAHAAVLKAHFSRHFLTIPEEAWDDNQMEFREYLEKGITLEPDTFPYIWVLSKEKVLKRAILTRDVVYACQERGRSWRLFKDLVSSGNLAIAEAPSGIEAEEALGLTVEDLKAAREEGASRVIDRLIEVLSGSGEVLTETLLPPSKQRAEDVRIGEEKKEKQVPEMTSPPAEPAASEEEAEETEEELSEEPYIESDLCTSCNECINLNSSMFQYNSNRQAYIADPAAGTYKQLVTAAENCPAKCIHPGTPRPGDETATEDVIARAKAYI